MAASASTKNYNHHINNVYTTMNRLLLPILLAVTAHACVVITGTCQTGAVFSGVDLHLDDNNG
ncbi:hypothetical protein THARTR1_05179 [Trichoderma harzianum]|uniref:Uncharacterized protein n=1 Tax=Trichoderma harzianum TaxID=5544 RepID=A0A2K0UA38_TRIHA|nr:hypothetical protein THARTR1_05179 [Trichoderma harzianum]